MYHSTVHNSGKTEDRTVTYESILFSRTPFVTAVLATWATDLFLHSSFFFQAEDGIRDYYASRGLGDVYKRQQLVHSSGTSVESWSDFGSC